MSRCANDSLSYGSEGVSVASHRYQNSDSNSSECNMDGSVISSVQVSPEKPSLRYTISNLFHAFRSAVSRYLSTVQDQMRWKRIGQHEQSFGFLDHLHALLKNIGITFIRNLWSKLSGADFTEERKVFMSRSKTIAAVRSILHILPVGAALGLLVLNSIGYYIGGELSGRSGQDAEKLAALSFAAKIHELTMLASLGAVLITYIRKELAFGDGLPFGALFSGLQFQDISFLWSLEMWGTIYHEWQRKSTKWFIICLILICTFLGLTVGPSTNNLMKPRLDDWPAGGTKFWINGTKDELFPRELESVESISHCAVDHGDLSCPAGNWQVLSQNYYSFFPKLVDGGSVPQNITVSSPASIRSFGIRSRNVFTQHEMLWGNAFTIATTPVSAVADSLAELGRLWSYAAANIDVGRFKYRNDATFIVNSLQPVVLTYCSESHYSPSDNITLDFPALNRVSLSSGPNTAATSQASAGLYTFSERLVGDKIAHLLQPGMTPSLLWVDDNSLLRNIDATLAAIFTIPEGPETSPKYFTCSVDSRLTNVTLKSTRNRIKIVSGEPLDFDDNGTFHANWPRIKPSAAWAAYLTPKLPDTNDTILSTITSIAGIFNSSAPSASYYYEVIVENIIATLVANGIGRSSYEYGIVMDLKDDIGPSGVWGGGEWTYEIIPRGGRMGHGGNAFDPSPSTQNRSTEMVMTAYVNGYAYSPSGVMTKLEMIVLAAYATVVITHAIYSIYSGLSSGSWGSAPEIAALAWNSTPSDKMKNTGAGISTVSVFKNNIRVIQKGDKLEILVQDNNERAEKLESAIPKGSEDAQGLSARTEIREIEPVEENKEYA
ncbi:hypothetical protein BDV59DRAFT_175499 [Aspergillus ambiguus]|uniref:uncharacterized protein n=1 Tax=Aspergillus ambiguus TaxID=176160 RepID=UPI003CCE5213